MISADEARELQKAGITQEEHLQNGMTRARSAITDTARKGKGSVLLAVFSLSEGSFKEMIGILSKYGFECRDCEWNERQSCVLIVWGKE